MKRILVGVDGSPESKQAAEFAAQVGLATRADLTLVYVTAPPPQVGPEPLWHDAASWQVEQKEYGDAVLREISTRCAEKGRIDVETRVEEGPVAETLAKLAGAAEVDFVAVGHRGRGNESVEFRSRTTLCGRVGTGSCVGCHRNSVCWASRSASPGAGVRRR